MYRLLKPVVQEGGDPLNPKFKKDGKNASETSQKFFTVFPVQNTIFALEDTIYLRKIIFSKLKISEIFAYFAFRRIKQVVLMILCGWFWITNYISHKQKIDHPFNPKFQKVDGSRQPQVQEMCGGGVPSTRVQEGGGIPTQPLER